MSATFEMAEQITPIDYDQALLMYNLGFSIEVETLQNAHKITNIMGENSIETGSLESKLISMGILDEHLKALKDVRYYANSRVLKHCGLHIEYSSGKPSDIFYGTWDEVCQKLIGLNRENPGLTKYVSNNVAYITI